MKKSIESFIIGMGSIMNIAGNYHDIPRYKSRNRNKYSSKYITKYRDKYRNRSRNIKVMSDTEAFEYDMKALQSDWEIIGQDFKKVIQNNPPSSFTK